MPVSKHEEKMIGLQYQMRENHSDLQNFLADLDSWEKDIKQTDEELKKGSSTAGVDALPPVRNTIHKKKLKKKKREHQVDQSKPKKISGFDFRAWDKFDVDKALEEIDKEEKKETSSSEYETDEEWELERKKHLAMAEKDKGNNHFKAGEYEKAVEAYSKGIEYDATSAVLHANRAMALLKQQKHGAAEIDCTSSISLDPMYVKAYLRRAIARVGLGKNDEAIEDYNRVLDLEPTNKLAKSEIEHLQKEKDRDLSEPPPPSTLVDGDQGIVKPVYKPPEERSKAPLRRILIEEIGIEKPKQVQPPATQSECSKKIREQESRNFDALLSVTTNKRVSSVPERILSHSDTVSDKPQPSVISNDVASTSLINSNCVDQTEEKKENISSDQKNKGQVTETPPITEKSVVNDSSKQKMESSKVLAIPQNSYQFQADYKLLKNKHEEFYKYFIEIPPKDFPKLFGQFLDADILTKIHSVLLDFSHSFGINTYNILSGLTTVKRFSMTAMFLSKKDKQVVQDLIQRIAKNDVSLEADLSSLKTKYDL